MNNKNRNNKYRELIVNFPGAIFITRDNRIMFQNTGFLRITGYSGDEFSDIPLPEIIHPDDKESVLARLESTLCGEATKCHHTFRLIHTIENSVFV